jgi:hypothetical protein
LAAPATPHPAPRADFIPVLAYARTAEIALLFLRKGIRAIVEGRLHEEPWKPPQEEPSAIINLNPSGPAGAGEEWEDTGPDHRNP